MGGFDVVDPRYLTLYETARVVLGTDNRVERVEVGGSIAADTADEWSDLDLAVTVRADAFEDFIHDWPSWLESITPTAFARTPIARFIVNAVTADGLTLDILVRSAAAPMPAARQTYAVGMLANLRFDQIAEALEYAVAEQLRGLAGPFISLVQRDEHLRHLMGVPHIMGLLTTVFLAETGSAPPGKIWNRTFTPEQRAAAAELPPVAATRDDIVAFGMAVAKLVITRARPLYPRYELAWPDALATVAATRLRDYLDIETGDWLY